jgi:hypothetical protein
MKKVADARVIVQHFENVIASLLIILLLTISCFGYQLG